MSNCTIGPTSISWEMENIEFPYNAQIGLSNFALEFKSKTAKTIFPINCNLIQCNPFNPDGVIVCASTKSGPVYLQNIEFWNLDNFFPQKIMFTFANVNTTDLKFFSANLQITVHNDTAFRSL